MDEQLLIRFFTQKCSAEEVEQIARWIAADKANANHFFELEHVWNLKDELKYSDKKALDVSYYQLIKTIKEKESVRKKRKYSISWYIGYAAAIVLLGLLSVNIYLDKKDEVIAMNIVDVPAGQRVSLTLSDGTKVSLNAGSRFVYPSDFTPEKRVVQLSGEGCFDVTHNERKPFIVKLPLLEVKVLGTRFNAKGYAGENSEITLERGKVEVCVDKTDSKGVVLHPNQQLLCSLNKDVSLQDVKASDYSQWVSGGLFFRNQSLGSIARELERHFDVRIDIRDKGLEDKVFNCHTKAGSTLNQILDILQATKQLTYIQKEKTITVFTPKSDMPMK